MNYRLFYFFLFLVVFSRAAYAQNGPSSDDLFRQARRAAFDQKDYPKAISLSKQALRRRAARRCGRARGQRSFAAVFRSRCELFRLPPLLSSHSWPGADPQVGHRIASFCLAVRSFIFIAFYTGAERDRKLFTFAHRNQLCLMLLGDLQPLLRRL